MFGARRSFEDLQRGTEVVDLRMRELDFLVETSTLTTKSIIQEEWLVNP